MDYSMDHQEPIRPQCLWLSGAHQGSWWAPGTTSYFQGKNIDGQEISYIFSSLNLAVYMSFIIDDTRLRLTYMQLQGDELLWPPTHTEKEFCPHKLFFFNRFSLTVCLRSLVIKRGSLDTKPTATRRSNYKDIYQKNIFQLIALRQRQH